MGAGEAAYSAGEAWRSAADASELAAALLRIPQRTTEMREAVNAILYLLRTGCPWRYLWRDGFPPRSTVYNIFRGLQRDGSWQTMWAELHAELRQAVDREASPTAAILDSQSIKSAEKATVLPVKACVA